VKRLVALSYALDESTPLYPGTPPIEVREAKSLARGDSSGSFHIGLSNHSGTHVDGPAHFCRDGRAMGEYAAEDLDFRRPVIIDCPKEADQVIGVKDLEAGMGRQDPDLLLIKTGFSGRRNDPNSSMPPTNNTEIAKNTRTFAK